MLWTTWAEFGDTEAPFDSDVQFDPGVSLDPFAGPGDDAVFSAAPVLMGIIFIVVVIAVVVNIARAGQTFATSSSLLEQTVDARLTGKRTQTDGGVGDSAVQTSYFATFETSGGERIEVKIRAEEYGQLAEGEQGQLTHQGTWYRGFDRRRVIPPEG